MFFIIYFFFYRNLSLLTILKDQKPFNYNVKRETVLKNFFLTDFQWLQYDIWPCWCHRDPLKQDLALEFCKNQNKIISILTETHINHDRIHHIRNNWLGHNSFSPGEVTQKKCFFCFIWVLKVSLRLTLIQKGGFFPLRLIPLTIEFSVSSPLGYSTREQLARGENKKMREIKTK